MGNDSFLDLFHQIGEEIEAALSDLDNWGEADGHAGQYVHDVVADSIAVPILYGAGLGIISEESEPIGLDRPLVAVVDPIDGSTNASNGVPWFSLSICLVNSQEAVSSYVRNLATGVSYTAERGSGSERDGRKIHASLTTHVGDSILALNDLPPRNFGWKQYRTMGSAALDLCSVADGTFDGYIDFSSGLAIWDYAGAAFICEEAGVTLTTSEGLSIDFSSFVNDFGARNRVVAGCTSELHESLMKSISV